MQVDHIEVGDTPVSLTANLTTGCYVGQVRDFGEGLVLYATCEAPPADDADYFVADGRGFFTRSPAIPPTWAKIRTAGQRSVVALARTGDV